MSEPQKHREKVRNALDQLLTDYVEGRRFATRTDEVRDLFNQLTKDMHVLRAEVILEPDPPRTDPWVELGGFEIMTRCPGCQRTDWCWRNCIVKSYPSRPVDEGVFETLDQEKASLLNYLRMVKVPEYMIDSLGAHLLSLQRDPPPGVTPLMMSGYAQAYTLRELLRLEFPALNVNLP